MDKKEVSIIIRQLDGGDDEGEEEEEGGGGCWSLSTAHIVTMRSLVSAAVHRHWPAIDE